MEKLLFELADLDEKQQADFFDKISSACNEKELQALKIGIAYFRLLKYPKLKSAMQAALAETLIDNWRA